MPIGDRAGLVQQQRIDVAGHFDRLAALGQNVGPQGPVHAGDADGGQQGADRRRNQAHQQGDQRRHVGAQALHRLVDAEIVLHVQLGVQRHRPERGGDDQEDQRERRQHQRQGDLVGRALADGAFDQGDHAVEERLAGAGGDLDDDAVGEHARAAGDAGAVAAGFANHRGRFAGDGRFVDRGHAFDDLAVAGDDLPGFDDDVIARLQRRWRPFLRSSPLLAAAEGGRFSPRLAQGIGLGLAARFGQGRGEVGEQHGQEQPDVQGQSDTRRGAWLP